jgi:hypothetical protein
VLVRRRLGVRQEVVLLQQSDRGCDHLGFLRGAAAGRERLYGLGVHINNRKAVSVRGGFDDTSLTPQRSRSSLPSGEGSFKSNGIHHDAPEKSVYDFKGSLKSSGPVGLGGEVEVPILDPSVCVVRPAGRAADVKPYDLHGAASYSLSIVFVTSRINHHIAPTVTIAMNATMAIDVMTSAHTIHRNTVAMACTFHLR